MPVEKILCSVLGVTALFAQAGAPQPARQLTARELFYTPAPPAAPKAPVKQSAPKKAVPPGKASTPTTVERPAAPPPVSSGGAQIIRAGYSAKPLGLRYSILRDSGGEDYREAAPDTVFHSGDRIRLAVEVNDDGFLYIAMKGSSGSWKVLFPAAVIAGGSDHVENGRQYAIPPAPGRFAFDEQSGEERLFIVFSRNPEPSLEQLIYSLGSGSTPAPGAKPEAKDPPRVLMAQAGPLDDPLIGRLRGQVFARDLVFETVDDNTAGDKKEKAVYVVNRTGSPDSRLVADVTLKHR